MSNSLTLGRGGKATKASSQAISATPRSLLFLYKLLVHSWLFVPAILFYNQVFIHLTNIPVMDDYQMPLEFVMDFSKASSLMEKLGLLFEQHGEHRLVASKLVYLVYYYITGGLNFKIIGIIGDLQLLVVAGVGVYFIRKLLPTSWKFPAIIWMAAVFDMSTYENACMCMNAVGNYGVIALFFAAIFVYDRRDRWIPLGVLLQFFCIFSNANGLAAGVLIALLNIPKSRKKLVVSSIATCLFIGLYFINYESVDLPGKQDFQFSIPVVYFIRQSGAYFNYKNSLVIGLVILSLLAVVFPWRKLLDAKWTAVIGMCFFAVGTMVLCAVYRSGYTDSQFQTSRYLIYPAMMIACLGLFVWVKLKTKRWKWIGGSAIGLLLLISYGVNCLFGKQGFQRTERRATSDRYYHVDQRDCETVVKEACQMGIYCIDDNR